MNEYERRMLDLAQNWVNLRKAAATEGHLSALEFFGYTANFGAVASGDTAQVVVPVQADAFFVLSYITAAQQVETDPDINLASAFTLQITDTGAGKTLYSAPSIASLLVGSANAFTLGIPILLAVPRVIRPNTNIKLDVTNFGTDNLDGIFISMIGTKVFTI